MGDRREQTETVESQCVVVVVWLFGKFLCMLWRKLPILDISNGLFLVHPHDVFVASKVVLARGCGCCGEEFRGVSWKMKRGTKCLARALLTAAMRAGSLSNLNFQMGIFTECKELGERKKQKDRGTFGETYRSDQQC